MKRTVAFLAAVCVSTGILSARLVSAQTTPPTTPPPPPPTEASGDTLKTHGESPAQPAAPAATTPKVAPAEARPDTMSAGAKARRAHAAPKNQRSFLISLGLGSGLDYKPKEFADNFKPFLGGVLAVDVRQYGVTAGVNIGFNFYMKDGLIPDDLNVLTIFGEILYSPLKTQARPYIGVCGGYFRSWIVDLNYYENVLGYGGGGGVEVDIDRTRRLFVDVRYIQGQTRKAPYDENKANLEIIPMRLGMTWEFR